MAFQKHRLEAVYSRRRSVSFAVGLLWLMLLPLHLQASTIIPRMWWDFVVQIDAEHRDVGTQHGKGIVLGEADSSDGRGLMVVTANHLIRSRSGVPATEITVRLPWDVTSPQRARVTDLFDAIADVAIIVVSLPGVPDQALQSLIIGCDKSLQLGAHLRVADWTFDDQFASGSFAGRDRNANLRLSRLPAIQGQSGAPIIDENGAVVGILTSSEGETRTAIASPFSLIERLVPDRTRLDASFRRISDEEHKQEIEQFLCEVERGACDRYNACIMLTQKAETSAEKEHLLRECSSLAQACERSESAACKSLRGRQFRKSHLSLYWKVIPICSCIDERVGVKALTSNALKCTEPKLLDAVYDELQGDPVDLTARLSARFPATRAEFSHTLVDEPAGGVWRFYQKGLSATDTAIIRKKAPIELRALFAASLMPTGYPLCERFPDRFSSRSLHLMQGFFGNDLRVTQVRTGLSFCGIPLRGRNRKGAFLFFQLDERWIFFGIDF